jgi:CelD/BcsL family acetyltransferase involved in cellulose biosynthesis
MAAVVGIDELDQRGLDAWRDLAGDAVEPNPFFEPEWVLPAQRHLGQRHVGVLVVKDPSGDWLGCTPVLPSLRRWHARLPVLSAWHHCYSFLGTPLIRNSEPETTIGRLVAEAFAASRSGMVALPWVGDDGPVAAGILAALEATGRRPILRRSFDRAMMSRTMLEDGVDGALTGRHRRDLRRLGRRLEEVLGGPLDLHDRSASAKAVEDFMELEATGWKGEGGTALRSRASHAEFFRELCDGFRRQGRLQLLALGTPERAVSFKCNVRAGDAVFFFKIAHDESFAHYRPGLQLELRMLELFRKRMNERWIDSCAAPDSKLFEHFWPERRRISSYLLAGAGHPVRNAVAQSAGRLAAHAHG